VRPRPPTSRLFPYTTLFRSIRIAPGFRIPFGHKHKNQEEVYVLVSGNARIKIEDEVRELRQWDAVRLHRDTVRGFEAGDQGAERSEEHTSELQSRFDLVCRL